MISCRRIILDGLHNARDLGGFLTEDGKVTKFNRFIRSEEISRISDDDFLIMKAYGIKHCLDLRSYAQIAKKPSAFLNNIEIQYHIIDIDLIEICKCEQKMYNKNFSKDEWSQILFSIIDEQKKWFGKAIKNLSQFDGGVIFNCYSGRNRSNLLAFLVLKIAKVPDIDIIVEYSTNELYLREKYDQLYDREILTEDFFSTPPEAFCEFIRIFYEKYVSVNKYLIECGVTQEDIDKVYSSFVSDFQ